jgi:flagellar protein FlaJ
VKNRIPFLPLPYTKILGITEHLLGVGEALSKAFPSLEFELEQAEFEVSPRRWASIALFAFIFYFMLIFGLLFMVTALAARTELMISMAISLLSGLAIGCASMLFLLFYPKLSSSKKIREIEKNLPYALHHILVEVRSGVPLYNCMTAIGGSDYGILSREFRKVVNEINTGKSEVDALEKLTRNTPSLHFRRVMWQLINTLKSGADIGDTIKEIVENMSIEQRVAIKKYGSQLNPLALMYMMLAVIFPTLGITFLLVLSSFTGLQMNMEMILMAIMAGMIFFQFMFIGLVKSRRPPGID